MLAPWADDRSDRAVISRGRVIACDAPESLGGRQDGKARVSWSQDGQVRHEYTDTPTDLVGRLSKQFGGEIPELAVVRPSLEDIYLSMIGHDLQEDLV